MEEPPEVFETTAYPVLPPPYIQLKGVLYELTRRKEVDLSGGRHTLKCAYVRVRDCNVELDAMAENLRSVSWLPLIEVDPEIHFKVIE